VDKAGLVQQDMIRHKGGQRDTVTVKKNEQVCSRLCNGPVHNQSLSITLVLVPAMLNGKPFGSPGVYDLGGVGAGPIVSNDNLIWGQRLP
jgi:hypothetical protein